MLEMSSNVAVHLRRQKPLLCSFEVKHGPVISTGQWTVESAVHYFVWKLPEPVLVTFSFLLLGNCIKRSHQPEVPA